MAEMNFGSKMNMLFGKIHELLSPMLDIILFRDYISFT